MYTSKCENVGKVVAYVGWRDKTVCSPDKMKAMFSGVLPIPDLKGLPESWCLGALGMTGYIFNKIYYTPTYKYIYVHVLTTYIIAPLFSVLHSTYGIM